MSRPVYAIPGSIPADLRKIRHWVWWYFDDKGSKRPCRPHNDASTWTDFTEAWERYEWSRKAPDGARIDGVGVCMGTQDSPYKLFGLDLDDSVESVSWAPNGSPQRVVFKPWARPLVDAWNGYLEISPSGTGVKGLGVADLPPRFSKKTPVFDAGLKIGDIEVYDTLRFFTVTGWKVPGRSSDNGMENVQEAVDYITSGWCKERAVVDLNTENQGEAPAPLEVIRDAFLASRGDHRINLRLWESEPGRVFVGMSSDSEMDFALMKKLAYWCDNHIESMCQLFLLSNRSNRKKIHDHPNYLVMTAQKALRPGRNLYRWKTKKPPHSTTLGTPISCTQSVLQRKAYLASCCRGVNVLRENGYEWDLDTEFAPGLFYPTIDLEDLLGSGCRKMKIRLRHKENPLRIKIVTRPCRTLSCHLCGPLRRDVYRRWYGSIAMQWPQLHRKYLWHTRGIPGLWFSVPVIQVERRLLRQVFVDRTVPGAEQITTIAEAIDEFEEAFDRWPAGTRVTSHELIRIPSIDDSEVSGKWEKHPRQCGFKLTPSVLEMLRVISQHGIRPRVLNAKFGESIEYLVLSDTQDAGICSIMDDGWITNGQQFDF